MTQGARGAFSFCIISGVICAYIAKKKGRSPQRWGALGFFIIGPITYILTVVIIAAVVGFTSK